MSPLFQYFSYYCCLPRIVFLQYSQICKSVYHRCAVFLMSTFTFSPALLRFPESFLVFCSHRVSRSRLPLNSSAACLHRALKNPVCFPTTQAISRPEYVCSFDFLDNSFSRDRFYSIPHTGFAPLRSFCLLVQKLSAYLLLLAVATLGFCCQPDLFRLSSIYLLSPPNFYLLNY